MFIKSAEEFEHFVAKVFELSGHYAEVTQASGDYGVDLVLNGEIAVQVKFYGTAVGPAAVQEVVAGRKYYKCTQAWVVTNSTYTPAAVTLAQVNDVRLIDGNELAWLAENPDDTADHGERYRAVREVRATFGMGAEDDFFDYEPNRHFGATTFTVGGITITRDQIERMSSRERNSFLMALTREQFEAFQDAGLDMGAIPDRSGICSHCGAPVYYTPSSPSRSLCAACEDRIQKLVQAEEQVQIRPAPAPAQGPPPPTQAQAAPSAPPAGITQRVLVGQLVGGTANPGAEGKPVEGCRLGRSFLSEHRRPVRARTIAAVCNANESATNSGSHRTAQSQANRQRGLGELK